MGYGISIINGSSRILIDSDQGYPTLYQTAGPITVSSGATYPATTDLIFARPAISSGATRLLFKNNASQFICNDGTTSYQITYLRYKAVTEGGFTPATTGYGLNIFNASSTCIFSATSTNFTSNIDIIAAGKWGFSPSLYLDLAMPNSTFALSTGRIYVLLSSTLYGSFNGTAQYFEYLYNTGTYGTIRINSYSVYPGVPEYGVPPITNPSSTGNSFAIAYYRD